MKERPILFSAPMVRAILEGRKTQTRRICKELQSGNPHWSESEGKLWFDDNPHRIAPSPFGEPGDRLWVRETFGVWKPKDVTYFADASPVAIENLKKISRWTPSIHMPRWASRITLEITNVCVERLGDITGADCLSEGVLESAAYYGISPDDAQRMVFSDIWGTIHAANGPKGWAANPWVWVISFKVVKP